MSDALWSASETDIDIARCGVRVQAEAHGIDTSDAKVLAFMEQMAQNIATSSAEAQHLRRIIKDITGRG